MNFMNKVFGKNSKSPDRKPQSQQTIPEVLKKLHETEEMLLKKQSFLESKIEKEVGIAKKNKLSNKKAAIQALHRKNKYQAQLQHVDGALNTLEKQKDVLEAANTNSMALSATQGALVALKKAQEHLNSDKISQIMDNFAEEKEITEDITNAISQPVASFDLDLINDDELELELESLEEEMLREKEKEGGDPDRKDIPARKDISNMKDITNKKDISRELPNVPKEKVDIQDTGTYKKKSQASAVPLKATS